MALCCDIRRMLKSETPQEAWRQFRWLVKFVCSPTIEYDKRIPHFRRLRPSNFVVNTLFLVYAVVWNLVHFPATLRARRRAEQRITQMQQNWQHENTTGY